LANLDFLRSAENVLLLSRTGIATLPFLSGATFQRELERLGKYLSLDKTASSHFFQVINQAYERQSVITTSNRPFQEWSGFFYDAAIVTAILDRVFHHAYIFNMKGDSYRLREYTQVEEKKVMPL